MIQYYKLSDEPSYFEIEMSAFKCKFSVVICQIPLWGWLDYECQNHETKMDLKKAIVWFVLHDFSNSIMHCVFYEDSWAYYFMFLSFVRFKLNMEIFISVFYSQHHSSNWHIFAQPYVYRLCCNGEWWTGLSCVFCMSL